MLGEASFSPSMAPKRLLAFILSFQCLTVALSYRQCNTARAGNGPCSAACRQPWEALQIRATPPNCLCANPLELQLQLSNGSALNAHMSQLRTALAEGLQLERAQVTQCELWMLASDGAAVITTWWLLPKSGARFSARERSSLETRLLLKQMQLDPTLGGSYKLISLNQIEPPLPPPPRPPRPPPVKLPPPPFSPPSVEAPAPPLESSSSSGGVSTGVLIGAIAGGVVLVLVVGALVWCFCRRHTSGHGSDKVHSTGSALESSGTLDARKQAIKDRIRAERMVTGEPFPGLQPEDSVANSPFLGLRHDGQTGMELPRPMSVRVFTYQDLVEATQNFDDSMVLGEGGFGRVYRGRLRSGQEVAVKKLRLGSNQGEREFAVEVEMLSRLHHRNLVKLVGYCSLRTHHLLCYELVPNGSLESWLYGSLGQEVPLDWGKRMKVAIGAARGLAYLHEDSQPCVIHRDFKASNILLDSHFNAKVADFGLAKPAPEGPDGWVSTRVMGTFGYVAPEYAMTGHLLVKSDVYSYGVVLLELVSGRRPVDHNQPAGQENIVTWARSRLKDPRRHLELLDPRLADTGDFHLEELHEVAAIAEACVSPDANDRPTMGEVVESLKLLQREPEYPRTTSSASDELGDGTPEDHHSGAEVTSKALHSAVHVAATTSTADTSAWGSQTRLLHYSSSFASGLQQRTGYEDLQEGR